MQPYATRPKTFKETLNLLEEAGRLVYMHGSLSGYEMAELSAKQCRTEGKALVFDRSTPAALNIFASEENIRTIFGEIRPVTYSKDDKLGIVTDDDYTDISFPDLPILPHYQEDVSGSINIGCVISEADGVYNCGIYRIQPLEGDNAVIHCYPESGLAKALSGGKDVDVTIALGTSPQLILAAAAPLPADTDELRLASAIAGGLSFIETDGHPVPLGTQIIIQATVSASEKHTEGPFMIYTGELSKQEEYPLMRIKSVKACAEPVYHTLVTGKYPMESMYLLEAAKKLISE